MGRTVSAAVVLSESAMAALLTIGSRVEAMAVRRRLVDLATIPEMGRIYDPEYPAARPDHEVRVTYAAHQAIYYVFKPDVGEDGTVFVEWIQDERMNPLTRFREF